MLVVCIYCKSAIRTVETHPVAVSHGVCRDCIPKLVKDLGRPISEFLDELNVPILIVHQDLRVVAGNEAARMLSPQPLDEICGWLCGDVIGCRNAQEPEGCGQTVHCLSCTIRRSVLHTYDTGEPCIDVPAYPDVGLISGEKHPGFMVSTQKAGAFVKLKINPIRKAPEGREGEEP